MGLGCHELKQPDKQKKASPAQSVAAFAFEGDLPASIFHLQLITKNVADWNAKAQVIVVFHTSANHVTLHDQAYNADRMVSTGNPYKELVADLMKRGVQVELCGATAAVHHWGNEDLLPSIKVALNPEERSSGLSSAECVFLGPHLRHHFAFVFAGSACRKKNDQSGGIGHQVKSELHV